DLDAYTPLYNRFKKYFSYMNTGFVGKKYTIPAYNGGLFKPDTLLDELTISDDVLYRHTLKLSEYDFQTEVDVNILGHIFEHSLNDIENVRAQLAGETVDKSKTKRKKDGVFYTPKYITKYIVDNTVGRLCEEKKAEIGIEDAEFSKSRKGRKKATLERLDKQLKDYRTWLLGITICDPACGSGAFLNQALNFLIVEHRYIDELEAQLLETPMIFPDVESRILEQNIYGVDINEESVEIARLSLWLRTAKKGRKLNSLSNHIKVGNSLIDDPAVAGDLAFDWEKEFPEVFAKGGFDVVVGNPPYVDIKGMDKNVVDAMFDTYSTCQNRINLYSVFLEKGYHIISNQGYLSFIIPNSILVNSSYRKIRALLLKDVTSIVKLPDHVFKDAIVETIIFELKKHSNTGQVGAIVHSKDEIITSVDISLQRIIDKDDWSENNGYNYNIYVSRDQLKVLNKIRKSGQELASIADFSLGITPYDKYKGHTAETIKNKKFHSKTKLSDSYKPLISGGNIWRHFISDAISEYINYGEWLGATREERFFTEPRVIVRQIVSGNPPRIYAGYTDQSLYFTQIGFAIIPKDPKTLNPYLLSALLNSRLLNFYHKYRFLDLEKELFQKVLIANCKKFPIVHHLDVNLESEIIEAVRITIEKKKCEFSLLNKFIYHLKSKFPIEKPSKNLQNWPSLDFKGFLGELKKKKVKLTLDEEAEWMDYFEKKKAEALALQSEIDRLDEEIDKMVYELYGLTEEEIKVVEGDE
ncbi:MAG: N-6 DNA methylase, partial [Flavobacteriales bacterium]|nr:N-6 DNA methylase [Flavobacteriales bacterium]